MKNDDAKTIETLQRLLAFADYQPTGQACPQNAIDIFDFEGDISELTKLEDILSGRPSNVTITAKLKIYIHNIPVTLELLREEKHLTIIVGNTQGKHIFSVKTKNETKFLYWNEEKQNYSYRIYCGNLPQVNGQLDLKIFWECIEKKENSAWPASLIDISLDQENIIESTKIESLFEGWMDMHGIEQGARPSLKQELIDLTINEMGLVEDEALLSTLNYEKESRPTYFYFSRLKWDHLVGIILSCGLLGKNRQDIFDEVPCELLPVIFRGLFHIECKKTSSAGDFEFHFKSHLDWPSSLEDIYRTVCKHVPDMVEFQEFENIWAMLCRHGIFQREVSGKYRPLFGNVRGIKLF